MLSSRLDLKIHFHVLQMTGELLVFVGLKLHKWTTFSTWNQVRLSIMLLHVLNFNTILKLWSHWMDVARMLPVLFWATAFGNSLPIYVSGDIKLNLTYGNLVPDGSSFFLCGSDQSFRKSCESLFTFAIKRREGMNIIIMWQKSLPFLRFLSKLRWMVGWIPRPPFCPISSKNLKFSFFSKLPYLQPLT